MRNSTLRMPSRHLGAVGLMLAASLSVNAQTLLNAATHPKFVNPLPMPAAIDLRAGGTTTISMKEATQWLGLYAGTTATTAKLNTKIYGYNGTYPGPSILAFKNKPVNVIWDNQLTNDHMLPIDTSVHWALGAYNDNNGYKGKGIPVVPHLHGGHTEWQSDGIPDAWFTPGFALKGDKYYKGDATNPYVYHNDQAAATMWYHDHAIGITRLNAYSGLAGFYILTDSVEQALIKAKKLPDPAFTLPIVIQDKMFNTDGSLNYPSAPMVAGAPDPSHLPEMFGDFILVNGMAWPFVNVQPAVYRIKMLNGCDSRFLNMSFGGKAFYVIGSDDGLMSRPVKVTTLLLAPGERKEILIDFGALNGQNITVTNNGATPYPAGLPVVANSGADKIIQFRVAKKYTSPISSIVIPTALVPAITPLVSTSTRQLILFESVDNYGRIMPMLGTPALGGRAYADPFTENPALNSIETWEVFNNTVDAHPIHLHSVKMQLINRQNFTATVDPATGVTTGIKLVGRTTPPVADEAGWKDTYVMYPGQVTRIKAKFDLPGWYVWHCHILSHEDHDMMRPLLVGALPTNLPLGGGPTASQLIGTSHLENMFKLKVFPNPFNTNLTIQMSMPKRDIVYINLYDSKGVFIKRVFEGEKMPGVQNFTIDGGTLANGTYFTEIYVNGQSLLRKVVLQK